MIATLVIFASLVVGKEKESEAGHAGNTLARALAVDGFRVGGRTVTLPAPVLEDGASADAERAALRLIAGSERAAADLTRDSVVAPFVLKIRDEAVGGRGTIRAAGLWFVVRASLDDIDPEAFAGGSREPRTVEAANMRFTVSTPAPEVLARVGAQPTGRGGPGGWYVHASSRMLDRVQVEATNRVVATRSEGSWLVASRTDPAFDGEKTDPNLWYPIARRAGRDEPGRAETYEGGVSVLRVSRLGTVPGALLVESQFAFFEPRAWFDGAPILRSKLGVVAQDRVRALRRELARSQKRGGVRSSSGPKGG